MSANTSNGVPRTESEQRPTGVIKQKIDGGVDLDKLVALLREKFGKNKFKVRIIHDVWTVEAPGELSQQEIESCK
ncbi:hypothetical protein GGR51DRAFT_271093 [Nemania sp. FL0031]|nr:hypothetical protein GGR51DRAFT_271093 [Nemania sp. FL0031]